MRTRDPEIQAIKDAVRAFKRVDPSAWPRMIDFVVGHLRHVARAREEDAEAERVKAKKLSSEA